MSELLKEKYPLVLTGYQFWARPIVKQMEQSKVFTNWVNTFAKPWSYEMAYVMGRIEKGDLVGKVLMHMGFISCLLIGMILANAFYINYIILFTMGTLLSNKWQKKRKVKGY